MSERRRAILVIRKLAKEYARFLTIEPFLWEYEPMLANGHFQDVIEPPRDSDIVVVILWSRLGTPLPEATEQAEYKGMDGRQPVTGTEWEFEDAKTAYLERGKPNILVYRKTVDRYVAINHATIRQDAKSQWDSLETFWARHFVEGEQYKTAYTRFEDPTEFSTKLELDLNTLIKRRINESDPEDDGEVSTITWFDNPFRGLKPFDVEHAPIFFGRSEVTRLSLERLLTEANGDCRYLLIIGASGVGKSSLVLAGIVPALFSAGIVPGVGLWRLAVVRPGASVDGPIASLSDALLYPGALGELETLGINRKDLKEHLMIASNHPITPIKMVLDGIAKSARETDDLLDHESVRLVVIVDQLEELFTTNARIDDQLAFASAIAALARSGLVYVIATIRSDHWQYMETTPVLVDLCEEGGRLDLFPPTPAELTEMIRRPADAAGLTFEVDEVTDVGLDLMLAQEAADEPGSLPLLSFLLDSIYQQDVIERRGNVLTYNSAEFVGGLNGAIAKRAEDVFLSQSTTAQQALPALLRSLVNIASVGAAPTARVAPMLEIGIDTPKRELADALSSAGARLLISGEESSGIGSYLRIAHESLLSHWSRANHYVAQNRRDLETRSRITEAMSIWRQASQGEKQGRLLTGITLAEGEDLALRWRSDFDKELTSFVEESAHHRNRKRRVLWSVVVGIIVSLSILGSLAAWFGYRANEQALISDNLKDDAANRAILNAEQRASMLAATSDTIENPTVALLVSLEAWSGAGGQFTGFEVIDGIRSHTNQDDIDLYDLDLPETPDYAGVAARIIANLQIVRESGTYGDWQQGKFWAVSMTHERIAMIFENGKGVSWNLRSPETAVRFEIEGEKDAEVNDFAISADGKVLAAATDKGGLFFWDAPTGALHESIKLGNQSLSPIAFAPNDLRLAISAHSGPVVILQLDDSTAGTLNVNTGDVVLLKAHKSSASALRWSKDGTTLFSASGPTLIQWNIQTAQPMWQTRAPFGIRTFELSPTGESLAAVIRADGGLVIWDLISRKVVFQKGKKLDMTSYRVALSRDGRQIAWGAKNGAVFMFSISEMDEPQELDCGTHRILAVEFSPNGKKIAASNDGGRLCVWRIGTREPLLEVSINKRVAFGGLRFDGTSSSLLGLSYWGPARLYNLQQQMQSPIMLPACLAGKVLNNLRISPSEGYIVAYSDTLDVACIWDLETRNLLHEMEDLEISPYGLIFMDGETIIGTHKRTPVVLNMQTGKVARYEPVGKIRVKQLFRPTLGPLIVANDWEKGIGFSFVGRKSPLVDFSRSTNLIVDGDFHESTNIVGTLDQEGMISLWNAQNGQRLYQFKHPDTNVDYNNIKFNKETTEIFLTTTSRYVEVWEFTGNNGGIENVTLRKTASPKDIRKDAMGYVVVGGYGTTQLIDVTSGIVVYNLKMVGSSAQPVVVSSPTRGLVGELFWDRSTKQNYVALHQLPDSVANIIPRSAWKQMADGHLDSLAFWRLERQRRAYHLGVSSVSRCLDSHERQRVGLEPIPPCWCKDKSYPTKEQWIASLGRDPFTGNSDAADCFGGTPSKPPVDWPVQDETSDTGQE